MITEYMIVDAGEKEHYQALLALALEVMQAIQEGWEPQGNHVVVYDPRGGFRASQAMVKRDNDSY